MLLFGMADLKPCSALVQIPGLAFWPNSQQASGSSNKRATRCETIAATAVQRHSTGTTGENQLTELQRTLLATA